MMMAPPDNQMPMAVDSPTTTMRPISVNPVPVMNGGQPPMATGTMIPRTTQSLGMLGAGKPYPTYY